ncbi:MAG: non-canonical purine NTP pyrophosphatase, partial [Clostridia bacterium]|nr:non-canonical purine NTP pyrophosphatase [Clostridia bacterium]
METIVIATGNKHKVSEIKEMLAPFTAGKYELISMREAGFDGEIEETGTTFDENAFIKASTVCRATGKITFADDSGLCVDALDGRPGVYSARYGGLDTDDEQISLLLSELKDVPAEKRTARFVAVFCAVFPDG